MTVTQRTATVIKYTVHVCVRGSCWWFCRLTRGIFTTAFEVGISSAHFIEEDTKAPVN